MMAGLLFARAGVRTLVLEKHGDFLRDFRGDTVHPSTMEILDELGLLERFLKRPHNRVAEARLRLAGREWTIGDLSHLKTPAPFIAMMPQWDFLGFLREAATAYSGFRAGDVQRRSTGFIEEQGRVAGVRLGGRPRASRPPRSSPPTGARRSSASCFRSRTSARRWTCSGSGSPSRSDQQGGLRGNVERGRLLVMIDRGDYWQCAFLIPKGAAEAYQARGIEAIREEVAAAAPRA